MHGSSPAAWTAVVVALIGFTLGGVATLMGPQWVLFWVGVALVLGSLLVAKVMSAAGLGVKSH